MKILFESPEVLVFDKPSGTPSVGGLDPAMFEKYPELKDLPENGLVHRLDTGTSGCLAYARTQAAYDFFRSAFHQGHADLVKHYEAVIGMKSESDFLKLKLPHTIDYPIARLQKSAKKMKVLLKPTHTVGIRGKPMPALTKILSLEEILPQDLHYKILHIRVRIQTGVMHQIRAHLSAIGAGILGDPIYKMDAAIRDIPELNPEHYSRFFLHAVQLRLPLPSGGSVTVDAPWDPQVEIGALEIPGKSSNLDSRQD